MLEVCRKTVVRDIAFMRDRLDLPIEYDPGIQAYRYTQPVNAFPTVQVTEGELLAMLVARRALEQYRGTPFHRQLEIAFDKLAAGLRDRITPHPFATLCESMRLSGAYNLPKKTYVCATGWGGIDPQCIWISPPLTPLFRVDSASFL
jgi:predicted DNA-binding transcriptional regulator YafY